MKAIVDSEKDKQNIINDDNLKITIDDFEFELLFKGYLRGRQIVFFKSSDSNNTIYSYAYRSKSELNIFRLGCVILGSFYKGDIDYVQQTFIHILLQKFINLKIDKIPKFKTDNDEIIKDELFHYITNNNPTQKNEENFVIKTSLHINNKSRIEQYSPFYVYSTKHKCGRAENTYNTVKEELKILSDNIENEWEINEEPEFIYNYKNEEKNENGELKNYYNIFIYRIKLKEKTNNNIIILYYMFVDLCAFKNNIFYENEEKDIEQTDCNKYPDLSCIPNKKCVYRNFHIPLFLTILDAKITKYGTYDKYIPAGNYICKFLEYDTQCTIYEQKYTCHGLYKFIARRYNSLFPFNDKGIYK